MRKLVESTFMTLDGVIESPQEWSPPYWDEEHAAYARKLLFAADALLLGRVTYEGFAQAWPARSGDEYTDRINAMPKYVASRTLQEATWNATVIQGDVADEVERLKREPGEDILKFGTGEVDRTLLANGLIDELHVWVFPVLVGKGQGLIDGIETTHLNLVETTRFASGIVVLTYAPKEGE
jgi:dihydrofolate reductase